MPKSLPCLGYPSRTAAAIALKAQGLNNAEIAARIGGGPGAIAVLVSQGSTRQKRFASSLIIGGDLVPQMNELAAARNTTGQRLAAKILQIVVSENLIDAVLDDEGGS